MPKRRNGCRGWSPLGVTSLEPSDTSYIAARMGIAETLTKVEPDGRVTGGVFDSWTASDDKLSWCFYIAVGPLLHGGTPITADIVKADFDRCIPGAASLKTVPIASVTAEGDTVEIATKTPFSPYHRS